jgi:putative sigma-54 modulation protein
MDVLVRNAEGNLSGADKDYAAQKLGRLDRFFHDAKKVEMVHREEKFGRHRVEITVFADHFTVRGEETEETVRAAIDKVAEKLENRLRRLKTRLMKSHRRQGGTVPKGLEEEPLHEDGHEEIDFKERKVFLIKPMSYEEAALQLEMIDHPFFVFRSEGNNAIEVIYKRKDGKYGLLQPEG